MTWKATPVELNATKFGNSLRLTDVIILSKFGIDWHGSFRSGEVQSLPPPIGTKNPPYHTQPCRACR